MTRATTLKERALTIPDADFILDSKMTRSGCEPQQEYEPLTEADFERIDRELAEDAILIRECRESVARWLREMHDPDGPYQRGRIVLRNLHEMLGMPLPPHLRNLPRR